MAPLRRLRRGPSPLEGVEYDAWTGATDVHRWVPSAVDDAVREFALRHWRLEEEERHGVRAALRERDGYTLYCFAHRQVLLSLRGGGAAAVRDGIAGLAAVGDGLDQRDCDWGASLLSWASGEAGLDARAELEDATAHAGGEVAAALRGYAANPVDRLSNCAYVQVSHRGEPGLWFTWGHDFDANSPLVPIAYAVQDVLEADVYGVRGITVATELPAVWLSAAGDEIERALVATGPVVTLEGQLDPAAHRRAEDQQCTAFLFDAGSESDAAAIAAAALPTDGFEALGVSHAQICCVLVARSYVMRVRNYEPPGALRRFERPLADALARA